MSTSKNPGHHPIRFRYQSIDTRKHFAYDITLLTLFIEIINFPLYAMLLDPPSTGGTLLKGLVEWSCQITYCIFAKMIALKTYLYHNTRGFAFLLGHLSRQYIWGKSAVDTEKQRMVTKCNTWHASTKWLHWVERVEHEPSTSRPIGWDIHLW